MIFKKCLQLIDAHHGTNTNLWFYKAVITIMFPFKPLKSGLVSKELQPV